MTHFAATIIALLAVTEPASTDPDVEISLERTSAEAYRIAPRTGKTQGKVFLKLVSKASKNVEVTVTCALIDLKGRTIATGSDHLANMPPGTIAELEVRASFPTPAASKWHTTKCTAWTFSRR
jgi:hypothetical protein